MNKAYENWFCARLSEPKIKLGITWEINRPKLESVIASDLSNDEKLGYINSRLYYSNNITSDDVRKQWQHEWWRGYIHEHGILNDPAPPSHGLPKTTHISFQRAQSTGALCRRGGNGP